MPLEQRVIAPIFVSRGCFDQAGGQQGLHGQSSQLSLNVPNELECVTNGTLANIIRQLSTLSRYAEDLFGSLLDDTSTLVSRSVSLKSRLDVLSERVERLDASNDSAGLPTSASATGTISRKPFKSRADTFDQQVVARGTIPLSLHEVYERCDQPPPLDKLNPFRDDNINGLKLYTNPNYFFELWRKEMLSQDRSRNKVAKKGENVHMSGGKSKRNKASMLRHQSSINSEQSSMNSPAHHQHYPVQQQQQQQMQMNSRSSLTQSEVMYQQQHQGPIYTENGVLVGQAATAQQIYAQQQKIYGHTGGGGQMGGQIYGYTQQQHQENIVAIKREEPNPSGPGSYTVIEGYSVDPNNYQHHYVQHQYNPQLGGAQQQQSRPNSLELSHQHQQQDYHQHYPNQQPPPPPPPNQMDQFFQQQTYGQQQRTGGQYGPGQIYSTQQQYPSPSANNLTPTRRAAQLSRPSAPPPAPPPGGSAPSSQPSTPKKLNGPGDMMAGHPALVSRDSLPPPPPPPPGSMAGGVNGGHLSMGGHHHEEAALPPPPPPPPPPMMGGNSMVNQNGNTSDVCSPPPPPPPPMNLNGSSSLNSTAQFAKSSTNNNSASTPNGGTTSKLPTAEMLQSVKLRPTQTNTNNNGHNGGGADDARSNLLAAIRHGIKLKRVEESQAREVEKSVPLHDVASILARRVAMELSDSEGEAAEEGDDSDAWDDESEC